MSKQALIDAIAAKADITKVAASEAVEAVVEAITKSLKSDGRFALVGFGTFTVRKRPARSGRNPQTGETISIAASKAVGFKQGADLKKAVG